MTAKPLQIKIIFAADEVCMVLRDMLRGQAKMFSVDQGQSKTNPFQAMPEELASSKALWKLVVGNCLR